MEEELDPFEWQLAESLGMTLRQMADGMSEREYASWRAFFIYRREMQKLESDG